MTGKTHYDEENKLWYAAEPLIVFNPKINLANAILWTLSNNPEKVIQVNSFTHSKSTQNTSEIFFFHIFLINNFLD